MDCEQWTANCELCAMRVDRYSLSRQLSDWELEFKRAKYRWHEKDLDEPIWIIKAVTAICCVLVALYWYTLQIATTYLPYSCVVENTEQIELAPGQIVTIATGQAMPLNTPHSVVEFSDHADCPSEIKSWVCADVCEPFDCWVHNGKMVWSEFDVPLVILIALGFCLIYLGSAIAYACTIKFKRRAIRDALHGTQHDVSGDRFGWD